MLSAIVFKQAENTSQYPNILSPIFLRIQTQLVRLLVGLLVGQLLLSFFILWYDLPTNSLTNYPTNNHISWIWMRKKMGL